MHRRKWHSIYRKPILGSFSSKRKQGGGGWCSSWRKRWSKKRGFYLELEKLPLVNMLVKIIQGKMENSWIGREGEGTLAHGVVRQRADCILCQLLQCPISGSFMEGSIHFWLPWDHLESFLKIWIPWPTGTKSVQQAPALVGSEPPWEFSCATMAGNPWIYEVAPTVGVLELSPSEGSQGFVSSYTDLSS